MTQNDQWRERGLTLLFWFGIANVLAAFISLVAFNWTYFANESKLGGLAALLIVAVLIWIWRSYDRRLAVIAGVSAQLLIGVWLAAAGQLYQAPGGLQDLLMHWALLGLPFALASRAQPHWAVWFGVITLFGLSPTGTILAQYIERESGWIVPFIAALITSSGLVARDLRGEDGWLTVMLGCLTALLLVCSAGTFRLGIGLVDLLTLVVAAGLALHAFRKNHQANTIILSAAVGCIVFLSLLDFLSDFFPDILFLIMMAAYVLAVTYGLIRLSGLMQDRPTVSSEEPAGLPWYVSVIAGAGGLLTAGLLGGVLATFIALMSYLQTHWEPVTLFFGLVCWIGSVPILRRHPGPFLATLSGAFLVAGVGMIVFSVGALIPNGFSYAMSIAGFVAIILAIISVLTIGEDGIVHGIMTLVVIAGMTMIVVGLFESQSYQWISLSLYVSFVLSGLIFVLKPWGGRSRLHISAIFWAVAMLTQAGGVLGNEDIFAYRLTADVVLFVIGLLALFKTSSADSRPGWPVLIGAVFATLLLPAGSAAALLFLLFGFIRRSRPLFGIGVAALSALLFYRYIDIDLNLLTVSALMAAVGAAFLSIWWLSQRRVEIGS